MAHYHSYNHPEIIEDNPDEMQIKVKCPYCGQPTTVGELIGNSGYHGCPNCYFVHGGLLDVITYIRNNDYPAYVDGTFYQKGFEQNRNDYEPFLPKPRKR